MAQITPVRTKVEAEALLNRSRKGRVKIGHNTWLERDAEGNPAVRLHSTHIVTYHDEGVELYSGGYQTVTTKDRLNQLIPWGRIVQERRVWYVILGGARWAYNEHMLMKYRRARIVGAKSKTGVKQQKKLSNQIRKMDAETHATGERPETRSEDA